MDGWISLLDGGVVSRDWNYAILHVGSNVFHILGLSISLN